MDDVYTKFAGRTAPMGRLLFLLYGGTVRRYHTVPTIKDNTLAEHQWGVAVLCYLLSGDSCSEKLLMAALTHDLPEQATGDIPAPAKRLLGLSRETFTAYDMEALAAFDFGFILSPEEKRILKLADCLDGMLFCLRERQLGNLNVALPYSKHRAYAKEVLNAVPEDQLNYNEWELFNKIECLWREVDGEK
jgi:5'-deoxynucleotidase YfbR-like HD superfamily hydrolase